MKISNLRIERHDGQSFLTVDIEAKYTSANTLWFSVPSEYEDWLTDDVYDAFLVAALCPAMYYNEPVEIIGKVSHKLFFKIQRYVLHLLHDFDNRLNIVPVSCLGFSNAKKKRHEVGTAFSAGVDSFATFKEHFEEETDPDYKISSLFFFNVGQHGSENRGLEKFLGRYEYLKSFAKEKELPFIPLDSNMFDFYQSRWEYDFGILCRVTGILIFEAALDKYYVSSDHAYWQDMYGEFERGVSDLDDVAEFFAYSLLSTEQTDIIDDGGQRTRIEKTRYISEYEPAQRFLNVCICSVTNCNSCLKCTRTLAALDLLGKLDKFNQVFDINDYKKHRFKYKCYQRIQRKETYFPDELRKYAKEIGRPYPPFIVAYIYVTIIRISHIPRKIIHIVNKKDCVQ